jgi:hypothetical protein
MPNYHNPLDIMPFPNEAKPSDGYVRSDHQKKESFVDDLLKQYLVEQKQKAPASGGDEILATLKKDMDRLQSSLMSMESKLTALHHVNQSALPTDMKAIGERFDRLYEEIQKKVALYLQKLEQALPAHDGTLKAVKDETHNPIQEKRLRMLKYYEFENIRLKQLNMKLMRVEYEKRIQQHSGEKTAQPRAGAVVQSAKDMNEINYLLNEIKKLEMKKTQLIKDNIQLNEFSHEIIDENNRLKQELGKGQVQHHKSV